MNPSMGLTIFIMLCFVLYAWFANRFLKQVVINQETFSKRNKDWLQVNAIVAFLVSVFSICSSIYNVTHPESLKKIADIFAESQIPNTMELIRNSMYISIGISSVFIIHIIWTIALVRLHRDHIID
jgi:ABC-type Fe3+ transport system permease subunit